jgi:hypothetical protein
MVRPRRCRAACEMPSATLREWVMAALRPRGHATPFYVIRCRAEAPLPSAYTEVALGTVGANVSGALNTTYGHTQHLMVDCPLFKV